MRIVNFSEARNKLKGLCDEVVKSRKPARIHRRDGDVVVVAAEDWDSIQETLYITSIPGAVERITGADDYRELEALSADALKDLIADQA
jgi:prevent-host-death family protein